MRKFNSFKRQALPLLGAFLLTLLSASAQAVVFQAENYSEAHDSSWGNQGGHYRYENVDIQPTSDNGGGYNVGWIEPQEWLMFHNLHVPSSQNYIVRLRVASPGGATASVDLNAGSIRLGDFSIPGTGGWQNWTTVSKTVYLQAGTYNLGVFAQTGGWNFNWIEVLPANAAPPPSGFASIVSEAQFNQMFPNRNPFYTYEGLLEAAAAFPAFAGTGNWTAKVREAAAALANFSHETGGLVHINEIARGEYCSGSPTPCGTCAPGKRYYGRGPIQLSWNYNYCAAGQALNLNLWANPDQVSQNPATAWKTSLWYWMTQQGAGYWTPHMSMTSGYGFGETIRTINGTQECNGKRPDLVQDRVNEYLRFIQILGGTPGSNLHC